jgi:hypothetical protein
MAAANRPKRVVVLDADNPMVEVHGEFFWREDHDVLVAEARELGYQDGYRAGWADADGRQPTTLVLRRRPTLLGRMRAVILLGLLAVGLVIVFATIAQQWMRQF